MFTMSRKSESLWSEQLRRLPSWPKTGFLGHRKQVGFTRSMRSQGHRASSSLLFCEARVRRAGESLQQDLVLRAGDEDSPAPPVKLLAQVSEPRSSQASRSSASPSLVPRGSEELEVKEVGQYFEFDVVSCSVLCAVPRSLARVKSEGAGGVGEMIVQL